MGDLVRLAELVAWQCRQGAHTNKLHDDSSFGAVQSPQALLLRRARRGARPAAAACRCAPRGAARGAERETDITESSAMARASLLLIELAWRALAMIDHLIDAEMAQDDAVSLIHSHIARRCTHREGD